MITVKQLKETIKDMPDDFKVIVYVKYADPTMLDNKFPVEEGNVYHASPFYFEHPECIARDEADGIIIPDYMKEECCHIRI